jgi:osmotically-inducible protein OsmY
MANNNQNQYNRPYGNNQHWQGDPFDNNSNDQYNRNRENEGGFGNAGFGNNDEQGSSNRYRQEQVNYIPDNDDNRYGSGNDNRGYQNRGYSNKNNDFGQQRNQWGSQWGNHYGASFGNQSRQSDQGNYGGQSGWGSVNNISGGYDINTGSSNNQNRYNDGNWQQRNRNEYGYAGNNSHGVNYGGNEGNAWNDHVHNKDDRGWWDRSGAENSSSRIESRIPRGNANYPAVAGIHKGKGPRGYQRSDERIHEDVCDRLSDDDMLDASEIEVTVNGAEVILSGLVLSREARRHAEDIAESVTGVRNIENRIRVGRADELEGNYTTRQILRAAGGDDNDAK